MVMEEINKIYPGMENRNTFVTNGEDPSGLYVTVPYIMHPCHLRDPTTAAI